jgi:hypothetical protein
METHMLFQTTTPDTSGYMIAGYAVAFTVMAIYVISLYLRNRNLNQDMDMLKEMDKPGTPAQMTSTSQPKKSRTKSSSKKSAKPVTKRPRRK